jgi:hypothetical protein
VLIITLEVIGLTTQPGLIAFFKVKLIEDPADHSAPALHH